MTTDHSPTPDSAADLPSLPGDGGPIPHADLLPPIQIPGYEILAPLGSGAMGVVWRARQLATCRDVAVKFLAAGQFASERARARFAREVEFAASLEHPGVARVYDSGLRHGVYYYAMELVEGVRLDRHVTETAADRRQIISLLARICDAVQHAHNRGVIHRDLKPSNILVTPDGAPHVVDFGLARATGGESGSDVTLDGSATGTPAFMAPEQAAGKTQQVDTRSDVYALGKILYLLVVGHPAHSLEGSGFEILNRIAHEEVRPPRQQNPSVDRDLQAVLLKSLARDQAARYASAADLARDLRNYLDGEPLLAGPATTSYFLRKRLAKYKVPVALSSAGLVVLVAAGAAAYLGVSAERSRAVREAAKTRATVAFLQTALTSIDPKKSRGRDVTVRELLDQVDRDVAVRFASEPDVEAAMRDTIGMTFYALGAYAQAELQVARAVELRRRTFGPDHPDTLAAINDLAQVQRENGAFAVAEATARQVLDACRRVLGPDHSDTLRALATLAYALNDQGKFVEAETTARDALAVRNRVRGPDHPDTVGAMNTLAFVLRSAGKLPEAEELSRRVLAARRRVLDPEHPETLNSMRDLASVLALEGKSDDARRILEEALKVGRRVLGPEHPDVLVWSNDLAFILRAQGRLGEAESLFRQTLDASRKVRGPDHVYTVALLMNLGAVLREQSKPLEGAECFRQAAAARATALGDTHRDTLVAREAQAAALYAARKVPEAMAIYRETLDVRRRVFGEDDAETLALRRALGSIQIPPSAPTP